MSSGSRVLQSTRKLGLQLEQHQGSTPCPLRPDVLGTVRKNFWASSLCFYCSYLPPWNCFWPLVGRRMGRKAFGTCQCFQNSCQPSLLPRVRSSTPATVLLCPKDFGAYSEFSQEYSPLLSSKTEKSLFCICILEWLFSNLQNYCAAE